MTDCENYTILNKVVGFVLANVVECTYRLALLPLGIVNGVEAIALT